MNTSDAEQYDAILKSLNSEEEIDLKNISNYDEKIFHLYNEELVIGEKMGYGTIVFPKLTPKGRIFINSGGFIKVLNDNQKLENDKELDRKSKKWAIINSKWSLTISILALLLSVFSLFKEEIISIFK